MDEGFPDQERLQQLRLTEIKSPTVETVGLWNGYD
jgi:hypothetical protein